MTVILSLALSAFEVVKKNSGTADGLTSAMKCNSIDFYRGKMRVECVAASISTEVQWNINTGIDPPIIEEGYLGTPSGWTTPFTNNFTFHTGQLNIAIHRRDTGGYLGNAPNLLPTNVVVIDVGNSSLFGYVVALSTENTLVSSKFIGQFNKDVKLFTFSDWEILDNRENGPTALCANTNSGLVVYSSGAWVVVYDFINKKSIARFRYIDSVDSVASGFKLDILISSFSLYIITTPPLLIKAYNISKIGDLFSITEWSQSKPIFLGHTVSYLYSENTLLISSNTKGLYEYRPGTGLFVKTVDFCEESQGAGPIFQIDRRISQLSNKEESRLLFVVCYLISSTSLINSKFILNQIEVTEVVGNHKTITPNPTITNNNEIDKWILPISILGLSFIILTAVLLLYCCCRIKKRNCDSFDDNLISEEMCEARHQSDSRFEWEALTDIKTDNQGIITATRNVTEVVAIQLIRTVDEVSDDQKINFNEEISVLASLRQKDILMMYGWLNNNERIYTMTEYCMEGTLNCFCYSQRLSRETAARSLIAVVRAIAFLHDRNIAHMDIRGQNVQVTEYLEMKLCLIPGVTSPLGKSVDLPIQNTPWRSPETMLQPCIATDGHDVFSFGCLVFEILTGNSPPPSPDCSFLISPLMCRREAGLWEIISKCCCHNPEERLTTQRITNILIESDVDGYTGNEKPTPVKVELINNIINSSAGNLLQYDIYQHPSSGTPLAE